MEKEWQPIPLFLAWPPGVGGAGVVYGGHTEIDRNEASLAGHGPGESQVPRSPFPVTTRFAVRDPISV